MESRSLGLILMKTMDSMIDDYLDLYRITVIEVDKALILEDSHFIEMR